MELPDEPVVSLELSEGAARSLLRQISSALNNWSGGHPYEQVELTEWKKTLQSIVLEFEFKK